MGQNYETQNAAYAWGHERAAILAAARSTILSGLKLARKFFKAFSPANTFVLLVGAHCFIWSAQPEYPLQIMRMLSPHASANFNV